ncbi:MAG: hypothetical protein QXQ95_08780 [Thermofilum sp.]|uniref:hypothetical protein n=1 Tax=Thermofilum sp. TaxID=1961369 RepID=UPI00318213A0
MPFWASLLVPPLISSSMTKVVRVNSGEVKAEAVEPESFDERWIVYGVAVGDPSSDGNIVYDENIRVKVVGRGVRMEIPAVRGVAGKVIPIVSFVEKGSPVYVTVDNKSAFNVELPVVFMMILACNKNDYDYALMTISDIRSKLWGA